MLCFEFYYNRLMWWILKVLKNGLDEFFSYTACVTPQNSLIGNWMRFSLLRSSSGLELKRTEKLLISFWWMRFPGKRSSSFPRNLTIRVSIKYSQVVTFLMVFKFSSRLVHTKMNPIPMKIAKATSASIEAFFWSNEKLAGPIY